MTRAINHTPSARRMPFLRVLAATALLAAGALSAACSTTEGFGKDVKNLGGGIEDSAAKNK